jgi:gas vesicle protein
MGLLRKAGALLTFAAGATTGLLFSTKTGKEVRDKMAREKTPEEKAKVLAEEAKNAGFGLWEAIRPTIMKAKSEIQKEVNKFKIEAKKDIAKLKAAGKKQVSVLKKQAQAEIKKDVAKAKKGLIKKATKAKKAVKKATSKK